MAVREGGLSNYKNYNKRGVVKLFRQISEASTSTEPSLIMAMIMRGRLQIIPSVFSRIKQLTILRAKIWQSSTQGRKIQTAFSRWEHFQDRKALAILMTFAFLSPFHLTPLEQKHQQGVTSEHCALCQ